MCLAGTACATRLLAGGADASLLNEKGCSALLHASLEGLDSIVAQILSSLSDAADSEKSLFDMARTRNAWSTHCVEAMMV